MNRKMYSINSNSPTTDDFAMKNIKGHGTCWSVTGKLLSQNLMILAQTETEFIIQTMRKDGKNALVSRLDNSYILTYEYML